VLASGNAGKAREFARLLGQTVSLEPLPDSIELPQETGVTFSENARLKAEAVADALGRRSAVLADDSGLEVEVLGGRPGVMSARFAGDGAGDEENVAKLLVAMDGSMDRKARFVCRLCLVLPPDVARRAGVESVEAEGALEGEVVTTPRGDDGFGYDPIFQPHGWSQTLAEAAPQDKDRVSHRGAGCRELIRLMAELGIV